MIYSLEDEIRFALDPYVDDESFNKLIPFASYKQSIIDELYDDVDNERAEIKRYVISFNYEWLHNINWHLQFYKITDFLVIHDELDLPFGAVKFKFGGGNGGHNGLKSIDSLCGNAYYRIRYGIGKPAIKAQVINWVLQDFSVLEEKQNQTLIAHCAKAALEIQKLQSPKDLSDCIASKYTLSPPNTESQNLSKATL